MPFSLGLHQLSACTSLEKIGGASAKQNHKTAFFILLCTRLALSLPWKSKTDDKTYTSHTN